MRNSCFNFGKDLFLEKSIFKKIDFLIKSDLCFVKDENYNLFLEELSFLDDNYSHDELEERIAHLTNLEFNQVVVTEVSKTVSQFLYESSSEKTLYGILLREKFESKLLLQHNEKSKKKLIKKHLKKALIAIGNTIDYDLNSSFAVNEFLTIKALPIISESIYNSYFLCPDDTHYNENINFKVKKDFLRHIFPLGEPQLNMYEIGESFLLIMDMLNFINELKNELIKLDHNDIVKKEATGSNYNLQNVSDNINRFPLVFKDAYSCELFLFIFSHLNTKTPILFSYFYEIFKSDHFKKRGFRKKYYFEFINSIYATNEIRVRPNISNDKHSSYINQYILFKDSFDKIITSKINS